MISSLTGVLRVKQAEGCVVDVGGVGYEVSMSTSSVAQLPAEGDDVTVLTHLQVRDDSMALYGFVTHEERSLFEQLVTVSGVGPKVALAALSGHSPSALKEAIAREDAALISTTPGIGKKTAERVIVELKDRLDLPDLVAPTPAAADAMQEAREALAGMGFSAAEVSSAVKDFDAGDGSGLTAETVVRHALRSLGRA
jgi:Holliday junction DNA helicase RuvA